jgi:hypothetical protein
MLLAVAGSAKELKSFWVIQLGSVMMVLSFTVGMSIHYFLGVLVG